MEKNGQEAEALHLQNGGQHLVGVKSLSVMLCEDDGAWFAQSLEFDYAAAGVSIEEVKANFELGLKATIAEHLKMHGSIASLLKPAPLEAWAAYYSADENSLRHKFKTIQFHDLEDKKQVAQPCFNSKTFFPFKEMKFLEPMTAC